MHKTTDRLRLILGASLMAACGCVHATWIEPTEVRVPSAVYNTSLGVVNTALEQIGVRYHFGGLSPRTGFDCSGLVYWSFSQNGITLPRSAREQFTLGAGIDKSYLREGDLVFFKRTRQGWHVGIMLDDHRFVHAPSTGKHVMISNLRDRYWTQHYHGARRLAQVAGGNPVSIRSMTPVTPVTPSKAVKSAAKTGKSAARSNPRNRKSASPSQKRRQATARRTSRQHRR